MHLILFLKQPHLFVLSAVSTALENLRAFLEKKSDAAKTEVNLWVNLLCFKKPRTKAPYQIVIGQDSPLLYGAGWPPLPDDVLPLIRRLLGKGCPGVV